MALLLHRGSYACVTYVCVCRCVRGWGVCFGAEGRAEVVPGEISDKPLLAVIPFNIDVQAVLPIVGELRRSGARVELELRGRKIGKAMSWANSIGADYTYVVGPRDLEQGSGMLKSLSSGEQTAVELNAQAISEKL